MKKLPFSLLLFILTSLHAKSITSTFKEHNKVYKLELNYKKINPKEDEGLLLTYKVYRDNKPPLEMERYRTSPPQHLWK